jgi:RNA polymerase sigma-70 factor (ECF subfamily)
MTQEQTLIELVRRAQQGHEQSMNQLAQEVKGRLSAYIYRVTLNQDLTQDLSQETLLAMIKSIDSLNSAERFWPWLYRIAQSKIQQHYRAKQKKAAVATSASYRHFLWQQRDHRQDDGLHRLHQKELSKKILLAMRQLRQQYRAVLSLRCFEQLPYLDIAVAMQCSEVKARVLFFRAKHALKKQLVRQGLSKGMLLTCLGLYGKLTAPADAASATVTVTSATTKVGVTAAVIATAGTKVGLTAAALALLGLATVGGIRALSEPALPDRAEVKSVHYTVQARNYDRGAVSSLSKGAYEQWYYFPEGVDGPVFMRMQRLDPLQKQTLCAWLQNDQGNYYYDSGKNEVYINNYRLWLSSLAVRRLPTDRVEFTDFLSEVEGDVEGVNYDRDSDTGLLISAIDDRFVDVPHFRTTYNYNTLGERMFQYSPDQGWPSHWPADPRLRGDRLAPAEAGVVDHRDQMHKRGWTYFRIDGQIGGQIISGRGRIPFVYRAWKEHPPWMSLKVGDKLEIFDCRNGAGLRGADGSFRPVYPPETFFAGLPRPWMGVHTIDIVRRDAASHRVWFESSPADPRLRGHMLAPAGGPALRELEAGDDGVVTLSHQGSGTNTQVVYTIGMENDIVKTITFAVNGIPRGSMAFSYLQDIEQVDDEFIEPDAAEHLQIQTEQTLSVLWLIDLAQGNLGR